MVLREQLVNERLKKKYTQADVAKMLGVSRTTVSKWESGLATMSLDHLEALTEILGLELTLKRKKKKKE